METALYTPGLGYYVNGRRKFGEAGDFVTAPEVSPLFSRCLARQVAQCLGNLGGGTVLEVGAGSGRMAADMLAELETLDALPERYQILELSPSLQQAQRRYPGASVPHLLRSCRMVERAARTPGFAVCWSATSCSMRCRCTASGASGRPGRSCRWRSMKRTVCAITGQPLSSPGLAEAIDALQPHLTTMDDGYSSELNLRLVALARGGRREHRRGYVLLIDYGYPQREYYHAERQPGNADLSFPAPRLCRSLPASGVAGHDRQR